MVFRLLPARAASVAPALAALLASVEPTGPFCFVRSERPLVDEAVVAAAVAAAGEGAPGVAFAAAVLVALAPVVGLAAAAAAAEGAEAVAVAPAAAAGGGVEVRLRPPRPRPRPRPLLVLRAAFLAPSKSMPKASMELMGTLETLGAEEAVEMLGEPPSPSMSSSPAAFRAFQL